MFTINTEIRYAHFGGSDPFFQLLYQTEGKRLYNEPKQHTYWMSDANAHPQQQEFSRK